MKRQNKIGSYLAVTTGVGSVASATAVTVTTYGINNPFPDDFILRNTTFIENGQLITYYGIEVRDFAGLLRDSASNSNNDINFASLNGDFFFRSSSTYSSVNGTTDRTAFYYNPRDGFLNGATLGTDNYAFLTFNDSSPTEAVAQFSFDGSGGAFFIAIASNDDGSALSIADGAAAIAAASIPEPSSLAVLALGATGLVARRQRKKTA